MDTLRRWFCTDRMIAITRWVVVLELVAGGVYFTAVRPLWAQAFPDPKPALEWQLTDLRELTYRNDALLRSTLVDVAVLKDNMIEVKWVGRAIATGFLGQVIIGLMAAKTRRRTG